MTVFSSSVNYYLFWADFERWRAFQKSFPPYKYQTWDRNAPENWLQFTAGGRGPRMKSKII
jgi:hypothetical protein